MTSQKTPKVVPIPTKLTPAENSSPNFVKHQHLVLRPCQAPHSGPIAARWQLWQKPLVDLCLLYDLDLTRDLLHRLKCLPTVTCLYHGPDPTSTWHHFQWSLWRFPDCAWKFFKIHGNFFNWNLHCFNPFWWKFVFSSYFYLYCCTVCHFQCVDFFSANFV